MLRHNSLWIALGALAAVCSSAWAQAPSGDAAKYPEQMVRLVVPFSAGSMTDLLARVVVEKLSERWKQQVIVENRPGLAGTSSVAKATADGYTLMLTSNGHTVIGNLNKNLAFDPQKDFVGVSQVATTPLILAAPPELTTKTVKELIDAAKAKPKAYQFGSAGNGTLPHLMGEMLNSYAGIQVQHIPYRAIAAALTDVISGQITMAFATPAAVIQHIGSGRLVALGVSSPQRTPSLPDVPAIAEVLPGFSGTLWIALFAPRGLPPEIDAQLQAAAKKVLESPDVREKLAAQGVEIANGSPEQVSRLLEEDLGRWKKIVKESGAKVD